MERRLRSQTVKSNSVNSCRISASKNDTISTSAREQQLSNANLQNDAFVEFSEELSQKMCNAEEVYPTVDLLNQHFEEIVQEFPDLKKNVLKNILKSKIESKEFNESRALFEKYDWLLPINHPLIVGKKFNQYQKQQYKEIIDERFPKPEKIVLNLVAIALEPRFVTSSNKDHIFEKFPETPSEFASRKRPRYDDDDNSKYLKMYELVKSMKNIENQQSKFEAKRDIIFKKIFNINLSPLEFRFELLQNPNSQPVQQIIHLIDELDKIEATFQCFEKKNNTLQNDLINNIKTKTIKDCKILKNDNDDDDEGGDFKRKKLIKKTQNKLHEIQSRQTCLGLD